MVVLRVSEPWRCAAIAAVIGLAVPAGAADFNLPVAARVVSFLQPPPSGVITGAIVYDPNDAASDAEAAAIERSAGAGLVAGRGTIRLHRVAVSALAGLAGARVAFVTAGLREHQADIAAAAARLSILTVTSDVACVQAGRCAVGVSAGPRVQITVSRAACRASNIQFGSAFLMLVQEV